MDKKVKLKIITVFGLILIILLGVIAISYSSYFGGKSEGNLSNEEIKFYDKAFETVSEKFKNGTLEMPDDYMNRIICFDKNGNEVSYEDHYRTANIFVIPSGEGKEKLRFLKVNVSSFVDFQYDNEVERDIDIGGVDYTYKWREVGKKIGENTKNKFENGEFTMMGYSVQSIFADETGYVSTEPFYEDRDDGVFSGITESTEVEMSEEHEYECWANLSEDKSKITIEVIARVWPLDIMLYETEITDVTDEMLGMKEKAEKEQYENDYELVNNLKSNICSRLAKIYKDNKIDMNGHDKKTFYIDKDKKEMKVADWMSYINDPEVVGEHDTRAEYENLKEQGCILVITMDTSRSDERVYFECSSIKEYDGIEPYYTDIYIKESDMYKDTEPYAKECLNNIIYDIYDGKILIDTTSNKWLYIKDDGSYSFDKVNNPKYKCIIDTYRSSADRYIRAASLKIYDNKNNVLYSDYIMGLSNDMVNLDEYKIRTPEEAKQANDKMMEDIDELIIRRKEEKVAEKTEIEETEEETKDEISEYELEQKRIEIMDRIGKEYLDRLEAETLDMNGETYKIVFIDWDGNEIPVSEEDIKEKGYYAVYEELEEEDRVALSLMIGFAYYHADDPEYEYTLEQDTELMFVLPCEEPGNIISGHNAERLITMDGSHKNYLEDKIKLAEEIANDVKNKVISGEIKDINSDVRGAKANGELILKDTSGIIAFSIIYSNGWIEIWDVSKPPITDIAYLYKLRYDENE